MTICSVVSVSAPQSFWAHRRLWYEGVNADIKSLDIQKQETDRELVKCRGVTCQLLQLGAVNALHTQQVPLLSTPAAKPAKPRRR